MAPFLVYNMAMYTVYIRCSQYGQCMVRSLAGAAGVASAWFIYELVLLRWQEFETWSVAVVFVVPVAVSNIGRCQS